MGEGGNRESRQHRPSREWTELRPTAGNARGHQRVQEGQLRDTEGDKLGWIGRAPRMAAEQRCSGCSFLGSASGVPFLESYHSDPPAVQELCRGLDKGHQERPLSLCSAKLGRGKLSSHEIQKAQKGLPLPASKREALASGKWDSLQKKKKGGGEVISMGVQNPPIILKHSWEPFLKCLVKGIQKPNMSL